MRLPKRRSLKPAPRPSPPPLLRERGPDAATRPRGPWAHLASFTCSVPPVGNFRETRLLAPPRGQCAVGGRAQGRGEARAARIKGASAKSGRQASLFHAPSLFPMKLCLASPFKIPPPFETLRMRSPSPFRGGPRRCVCVRAVHAGRAEGGRAIRCSSPGSRRGEGAADSTSGRPASLGTAPGAGTGERRPKSPDVVEPKQTRSSRARHAHLPPGGSVAAK